MIQNKYTYAGLVGIGVGTATYFLSKKNKTFTIIGVIVGGIAGAYIFDKMRAKTQVLKPAKIMVKSEMIDDNEDDQSSNADGQEIEWNPTINKMMPVGTVLETNADEIYNVGDNLDLDLDFN